MLSFQQRVALRIASVSALLALVASPLAWYVSRENAEDSIVAFAIEESNRLLRHHEAFDLQGEHGRAHAEAAARTLSGGLFDIAEIYSAAGIKLAEGLTEAGEALEQRLPAHDAPNYTEASYESRHLADGGWVLRVFVPIRDPGQPLAGYFEGVRLVPEWQRQQIWADALAVALMVALASLACGGVLYPVVIRLAADNARKARDVLESHIAMMEAMGRAIAKRDSDTGAHNYRVAWISARLAEAVGLRGGAMQALIAGSFLHDAGKIGIPDAILLKPGKLTAEEMAIMRTHVAMGEEIVTGAGWLDGGRDVVACHHEKWDGSGYPRGLTGEDIPLVARIFAIADVFDALCSRRPYKEPLPLDAALRIVQESAGSHFDPRLVEVFCRMAGEIHATVDGASEAAARRLMGDMVRRHFGA